MIVPLAQRLPITILLTLLLYQAGYWLPYSGDGSHMAWMAETGWAVTQHSVLTSIIHRLVYLALWPFGVDGWHALMVSSALAGSIAIQVLWRFWPHPLFLGANLLTGSFLVFAGEVENYAWVNLFLLWTFIAVHGYLDGKRPLWHGMVLFGVAVLCHNLALFYLFPLFYVLKRRWRFHPGEFLWPFLGALSLNFLLTFLMPNEGFDLGLTRLVPLFEPQREGHWFTFFSQAHLEIKVYFFFISGLFGLPLGWPLVLLLYRRLTSTFHIYLLLNALVGLLWFIVWHPDLGWIDWDLFSQPKIPLHFLVGLLLAGWSGDHLEPRLQPLLSRLQLGRFGR